MHSCVTSKNAKWCHLIWPTLYIACVIMYFPVCYCSIGSLLCYLSGYCVTLQSGGTAAVVPPPFRPSDPALCGSCPLVTPYPVDSGTCSAYFVYILLCLYYHCMSICVFSCFRCLLCLVALPSLCFLCWP